MAGDWLKREKGFSRKREVVLLAARLGISRGDVAEACFELWEWADDNISNDDIDAEGHASVRLGPQQQAFEFVDTIVGIRGFAAQMCTAEIGWLRHQHESILFVNYARHNSVSAKERALASNRKARQRAAQQHDDTELSRLDRDKNATRAEIEREIEKQQQAPPDPGKRPAPPAPGPRRAAAAADAAQSAGEVEGEQDQHNLVRQACLDAGIGAPTSREFISHALSVSDPTWAAEKIQRIRSADRGRGKGVGATVENIRAAFAQEAAKRAKKTQRHNPAPNCPPEPNVGMAGALASTVTGDAAHYANLPPSSLSVEEKHRLFAPARAACEAALQRNASEPRPRSRATTAQIVQPTSEDIAKATSRLNELKRAVEIVKPHGNGKGGNVLAKLTPIP